MKKLIKWSVILGIICCMIGTGVITAGAMNGGGAHLGDTLRRFDRWDGYWEARVEEPWDRYWDDDDSEGRRDSGYVQSPRDNTVVPGEDNTVTAKPHVVVPSDSTPMDTLTYYNVRELKIEAGPGDVVIHAEDREDPQDTSIRIETHGVEGVLTWSYDIRQEQDELEIERNHEFENVIGPRKDRSEDYTTKRMESLVLYIPRDYQFREVEIEAAASDVTVDEIHTQRLGLELMAGSLTITKGTVGAELDAECMAGSMNIGLEGKKTQFNYELTSNAGSIILAGAEEDVYTGGLHQEKDINYHATKSAELECQAGEIWLQFTETDN